MIKRIPYKWLVATAFVFGLFMELLDMTVLNTALPTLGREFNADAAMLQWPVTGYLVSLAIFIPASGWVADRFGARRTFGFAVAIFTIASLIAGLSTSLEMLTAARFLQGVGGGMLTPVGTAMLFRAFPAAERAKASAVLVVPAAVAPALGPVIGGWLVDAVSWRWIFFLNLPVGAIALAFVIFVLRDDDEQARPGAFDLAGFVLAGAALAGLLFGLDRGPTAGWTDPITLISLIGGVLLAGLLVAVELPKRSPLLDLRLLNDRLFRLGNLISLAAGAATMGVLFMTPLLLQQELGLTATQSGLITACQAVGMVLAMPLASKLYTVVGPRVMLVTGLLVTALANLGFLAVQQDTSLWWIRGIMLVSGAAMGLVMVPMQATTFATITGEATARASAVFSTTRQIASAAGVAVLASLLSIRLSSRLGALGDNADAAARHTAAISAYHDAFLVTAALTLIGIAFAVFVRGVPTGTAATDPEPDPGDPLEVAVESGALR
ncbi:MDR family MFS transporter [Nocardia sp. NPDC056100]|uniref:MDR family MFS transporter n=1 Tax=Nocardia sp. NPDC056100 TaxID=3345712 RepID=UPI0035DE062B